MQIRTEMIGDIKVEFIAPANTLKTKVGSGGLSPEILAKAQDLIENNNIDFRPYANKYLKSLNYQIAQAKLDIEKTALHGELIVKMCYPAMQLKANGAMFQYPLISKVAGKLIYFLEAVKYLDIDSIEIIEAFYKTMRAIILASISGHGGKEGADLVKALDDACLRYFEKGDSDGSDDSNERKSEPLNEEPLTLSKNQAL